MSARLEALFGVWVTLPALLTLFVVWRSGDRQVTRRLLNRFWGWVFRMPKEWRDA